MSDSSELKVERRTLPVERMSEMTREQTMRWRVSYLEDGQYIEAESDSLLQVIRAVWKALRVIGREKLSREKL